MNEKKPLIVIAGPTACGKSGTAAELGRLIDGEVISCDSMQVYRYMDIGSAKITLEEMLGVPHHMLDVCDPTDAMDVNRFAAMAKECVEDVQSRGKVPILCGGTGFYIQAVVKDIDFDETSSDTAFREEMSIYADTHGPDALHAILAEKDPRSAKIIHPNNVRRVIRALEYFRETGMSIADHNEAESLRESPYDVHYYVLNDDRAYLYDKIEKRIDFMMAEGLMDEVMYLKGMGLNRDMVSMQGLGYKEMLDYLEERCTLDEAVEALKAGTRHYAKRQITWFKREKDAVWIDRRGFDRDDLKTAYYIKSLFEEETHETNR